jgi:hypothetical protein
MAGQPVHLAHVNHCRRLEPANALRVATIPPLGSPPIETRWFLEVIGEPAQQCVKLVAIIRRKIAFGLNRVRGCENSVLDPGIRVCLRKDKA